MRLRPSCADGRAGRRSDEVAVRLVGEHATPTVTEPRPPSGLRLAIICRGYAWRVVQEELGMADRGGGDASDEVFQLACLTVE